MRITAPPPHVRVPLEAIDLADTALYATGDAHSVWRTLRAECPLFWQERVDGEGFWAVTRRTDVRRVLAEHALFTSEGGTAIAMLEGPDPAAGKMMQSTDPPRHRQYRNQLGPRFTAGAVAGHSRWIRSFVRDAIVPGLDGEVWDAAATFARLPMAVAARMMGLSESDVDPLVERAFASLAPQDPRYSRGSEHATASLAHYDIITYFEACLAQRRADPSHDLIDHLLTMTVDGRPLTDEELLVNCLSLLLGAVVTTSQAISATFVVLAEQRGGIGRWPVEVHLERFVDEALRWASPVVHFMRRARTDVHMHGRTIRAGEAVTAWIASANRDESVFDAPYVFAPYRMPNPHVTFGSGPHRCLGSNLAKLMLHEAFAELVTAVDSFELAGEPEHLVSNEIAGFISLPLRMKAASRRAAV